MKCCMIKTTKKTYENWKENNLLNIKIDLFLKNCVAHSCCKFTSGFDANPAKIEHRLTSNLKQQKKVIVFLKWAKMVLLIIFFKKVV